MEHFGRILIVDDDPAFLETYRDILSEEGYLVATAQTRSEALERLDQGGWDVVLVDQKLQGPGGPDNGLDLIGEIQLRAPGAKALIVTGYAAPDAIERAYAAGIFDYLEKTRYFGALLRAKVRNATQATRDRRLSAMEPSEADAAVRETWREASATADPHRKGKLLEDLLVLLLKTIPGFSHVEARRRNEIEEIDVVVRNESRDPLWAKESPYILVECKNWSRPVDPEAYDHFRAKLIERSGRCKLGIFVAPGGFSSGFRAKQERHTTEDTLIITVGRDDLEALVASEDRNAVLKDLHQRATLAADRRP